MVWCPKFSHRSVSLVGVGWCSIQSTVIAMRMSLVGVIYTTYCAKYCHWKISLVGVGWCSILKWQGLMGVFCLCFLYLFAHFF